MNIYALVMLVRDEVIRECFCMMCVYIRSSTRSFLSQHIDMFEKRQICDENLPFHLSIPFFPLDIPLIFFVSYSDMIFLFIDHGCVCAHFD